MQRPTSSSPRLGLPLTAVALGATLMLGTQSACSKRKREAAQAAAAAAAGGAPGGGVVKLDGSSTVFLISKAVAEDFGRAGKGQATVGNSGTGGGFKKFCAGEIEVSGASRPIDAAEIAKCAGAGIEFIELPVAYDGLAVVVNAKNTWVDHLTVAELKTMWSPEAEGKVSTWAQIRPGWPDSPLRLFGAGTDSGTFEYFTEAIVGKKNSSRSDYTRSEDDNALVQGVKMDDNALGYFGYAYYDANKDVLKVVPIDDGIADNGAGPITPSADTVSGGTYQPLSRPLFIYVAAKAAGQAIVTQFVDYYLANARTLAAEVGYVALPPSASELVAARWAARTTGSLFSGKDMVGVTIEALIAAEHGGDADGRAADGSAAGGSAAPTTP
ncbi:MAG: PstS family phosphate ABC transporter substrate-binding protein [Kofleriaceae bacterium]